VWRFTISYTYLEWVKARLTTWDANFFHFLGTYSGTNFWTNCVSFVLCFITRVHRLKRKPLIAALLHGDKWGHPLWSFQFCDSNPNAGLRAVERTTSIATQRPTRRSALQDDGLRKTHFSIWRYCISVSQKTLCSIYNRITYNRTYEILRWLRITNSISTNYWFVPFSHTPPQYGAILQTPTIVTFKLSSRNVLGS